jgi:hypothetical protein
MPIFFIFFSMGLRRSGVVAGQDAAEHLDDRHLAAELRVGHAELAADDARADDDEVLRDGIVRDAVERVADERTVVLERRDLDRARAVREDQVVELESSSCRRRS